MSNTWSTKALMMPDGVIWQNKGSMVPLLIKNEYWCSIRKETLLHSPENNSFVPQKTVCEQALVRLFRQSLVLQKPTSFSSLFFLFKYIVSI